MLYRFDLTCCALAEKAVDWTQGYHGLTAEGFAESIDRNENLRDEIQEAWRLILQEEENRWVLDYCGPGSRLAMPHLYALTHVIRAAPGREVITHQNKNAEIRRQPTPPPAMGPRRRSSGKLLNACRRRAESRKEHLPPLAAHERARGATLAL